MAFLTGTLALWSLFGSAFVSATLAPGGSEAVLAYLVAQAELSPEVLLLTATSGNTLGAVTTWGLGFFTAVKYPAERLAKPRQQKAVSSVRRWGLPILLLSWLPVVGDGFCFAAGWLRMPFWRSLFAIAIGKALRYAAVVYAFI
ncbi:YqaA family protein [Methylocaldum sp.]|uniref:YqaA family protein n=1 Tax=Methylocaldum sp. TaxID=1969727 RepID=UPI002D36C3BF|nr:YqaA family protein [Methylocaldum sp.]HYE35558.1 YqaA family protein [Methylocaldum sp.]